MEKLANVHPGEILQFEFLEPLEITAYRLSKDLKIKWIPLISNIFQRMSADSKWKTDLRRMPQRSWERLGEVG